MDDGRRRPGREHPAGDSRIAERRSGRRCALRRRHGRCRARDLRRQRGRSRWRCWRRRRAARGGRREAALLPHPLLPIGEPPRCQWRCCRLRHRAGGRLPRVQRRWRWRFFGKVLFRSPFGDQGWCIRRRCPAVGRRRHDAARRLASLDLTETLLADAGHGRRRGEPRRQRDPGGGRGTRAQRHGGEVAEKARHVPSTSCR